MTRRRVLITGASKGIGRALAEQLAGEGHTPVGIARSAPQSFPGEFHEADLADRAATDQVLREVMGAGPVDAVVNNVGMVRPAPVGEVALSDLDAVLDMNVRTALQIVQAVLPGMLARSWGRVVNVTSLVTLGLPDRTSYGAAKAAMEFLTSTPLRHSVCSAGSVKPSQRLPGRRRCSRPWATSTPTSSASPT
jgi:NAD(P)-dependent dehydrogenase (short-subunit alcohol dehydrogenase family)